MAENLCRLREHLCPHPPDPLSYDPPRRNERRGGEINCRFCYSIENFRLTAPPLRASIIGGGQPVL